jgi:hypothetical protein
MAKNKATTVATPTTTSAAVATPPAPATPTPTVSTGGANALPTGATAAMLANLNIVGGLGGINNATPPAPATPAKVQKVPGVSPNSRTRAFCAGLAIATHGHANGVTPALVQLVNTLYGDHNDIESTICAKNAWHVLRAFYGAHGQPVPGALPTPPAPQAPATPANG